METASDMAFGDIMGGEVGVLDGMYASGRYIGPGNEEERRGMAWSPSGDNRKEVFVMGGCDALETRLTREELLLLAVEVRIFGSTEVTTCCLG